jgi:hypothetical protein
LKHTTHGWEPVKTKTNGVKPQKLSQKKLRKKTSQAGGGGNTFRVRREEKKKPDEFQIQTKIHMQKRV